MAKANETDHHEVDPATASGEMPAARDLRALLDQIAHQISDTRYDQSQTLDGMRSRASDLADAARSARSSAGSEHAPGLGRIEAGMADLAGRCAVPQATGHSDEPWDHASAEALASIYDDGVVAEPPRQVARGYAASAPSSTPASGCPMSGMGLSASIAARQASSPAPAAAPAPVASDVTADWLDSRFSEIARRLEQTLAAHRPEPSFDALVPRFDRLEEHVGAVLKSVAARPGAESLGGIEAQIANLASHVESAQSQLGRLDEIEAQLKTVSAWLGDDRLGMLLDDRATYGADLSKLVGAAAEQACARIAAELSNRESVDDIDNRDAELRSLIETFMAERRVSDDMTATALDTLQQAMISLLDRVEALEPPAPVTREAAAPVANLGIAFEPPKPASAAPASALPVTKADAAKIEAKPAPVSPAPSFVHAPAVPLPAPAAAATAVSVPEPPALVLPASIAQPRPADPLTATPLPASIIAAAEHPRDGGSPIDKIRQDLIADAQRAKARATAEHAGASKAQRSAKPASAKSVTGFLSASQLFGTSKAFYGVPTKRVLIGALALLVAINGALLLMPRRATAPATPPAATKPVKTDQGGSGLAPASPAGPRAAVSPDKSSASLDGVQWPGVSQTFASADGDVGAIADGDQVEGITLQSSGPASGATLTRLQQRKSQAEMSTRLGAAAAKLAPAAYLPETMGELGEVPVTSADKPEAAAEMSPRDLPPAMVGPLSLRVAAANGDASAEFEVGARLAEGKGVDQDLAGAVRWYQRSASRGFAQAQYRLATFYERGLGVKADVGRARVWYLRASEQGNVKAMHNLAVMSAGRDSGAPDYAAAAKWFFTAAERDLQDSQFNYAVLSEAGLGVEKSDKVAYKWFALAARNGDAEAVRRRDQVKERLPQTLVAELDSEIQAFAAKPVDRLANDPRAAGEDWKTRQSADVNG